MSDFEVDRIRGSCRLAMRTCKSLSTCIHEMPFVCAFICATLFDTMLSAGEIMRRSPFRYTVNDSEDGRRGLSLRHPLCVFT